MADAFGSVWSVAKTDFRLRTPETSMGVSYSYPKTYKYRVPIGRDAEGGLIYGPKEHEVSDTSFVQLAHADKNRGTVNDARGVADRAEDWGPWARPPPKPSSEPVRQPTLRDFIVGESDDPTKDWVSGRGIMNTIAHEAIHDADPIARYMTTATGRPKFGARRQLYHRGPVSPKGRFYGVMRPQAGATSRDPSLAAEAMAYHGSYLTAPGKANLRTMRHSNVARSDVSWMLRGLAEARKREGTAVSPDADSRRRFSADSPEEILHMYGKKLPAYIPQPKSASDIIGIHATDTPETANFAMPKSQQIRRNLINAVNEMAMTRMTESGEFLEDYATSLDQTRTKRNRPPAARIKRMERETSPVRRAINAHWKKIEAGKVPVPDSLEDLPENIQRQIGQQQIRGELGLRRGRASEAIEGLDPAEELEAKLREKIGRTYRGYSDYSWDEQREKWEKLPFEEQEAVLRDYLTELSGMMRVGVPRGRYGEPVADYKWGDDIFDIFDEPIRERKCREHDDWNPFCDKKDEGESETGCDGYDYPRGKRFRDLREEFPHIFNRRWETHGYGGAEKFAYRGAKPGKKHRIVPHRYTPPPGIPEQDWLEMLQWASGKREPYEGKHQIAMRGEDTHWAGNRRM